MRSWFWNIDRRHQSFFAEELLAGRLRQGWGYQPRLDLRTLKGKLDNSKPLDDEEQVCWKGNSPMFESIEEGDLVVVKNVPTSEDFTIVKVSGPYNFQIDPDMGDFGHYLPVTGLRVYNKLSSNVPAPFANALNRAQNRIRVTNLHDDTVALLYLRESGESDTEPEELLDKLHSWRESLIPELKKLIRQGLNPGNAERLVLRLLEREGIRVEVTAGPNERGADLIGSTSVMRSLTSKIAIQVKMHWDRDDDTTGVDQLEKALTEHNVDACLLVSFADELGVAVHDRLKFLKRGHNVEALYGDELYSQLFDLLVGIEHDR
jgi:hypothetical protein